MTEPTAAKATPVTRARLLARRVRPSPAPLAPSSGTRGRRVRRGARLRPSGRRGRRARGDRRHSGVQAAAPSAENGACVCYTCTNLALCSQGTAAPSCGGPGTSGCGGDGGGPGEKGGGGGSSVAVFAVDSLVEVRGGALVSGDGGKGGKGGRGGEAGPGGEGETGASGPTCRVMPCELLLCSNEGGDGRVRAPRALRAAAAVTAVSAAAAAEATRSRSWSSVTPQVKLFNPRGWITARRAVAAAPSVSPATFGGAAAPDGLSGERYWSPQGSRL